MRTSVGVILCALFAACETRTVSPTRVAMSDSLLVKVPDDSGTPLSECSGRPGYFGGTDVADREGWYGKHLLVLGERPLCASSTASSEVYRFTWLPSFDPSVVVRVERKSEQYVLEAKTETGAGGYDPGQLSRSTVITLTDPERAELARLLEAWQFWEQPTEQPSFGLDGSQWILEGVAEGRYHVVDRWSPTHDGPLAKYRVLGEWLLQKSGLATGYY